VVQYYYLDRQIKTEDIVDGAVTVDKLAFETIEKVGEVELTSNTTSVTFTGLNGDEDKVYIIIADVKQNTSVSGNVDHIVKPNGTSENMDHFFFETDGSSTGTGTRSDWAASQTNNNYPYSSWIVWITAKTGTYRSMFCMHYIQNGSKRGFRVGKWTDTTTNITSITIQASQTDGFAPGSRFILLRLTS